MTRQHVAGAAVALLIAAVLALGTLAWMLDTRVTHLEGWRIQHMAAQRPPFVIPNR